MSRINILTELSTIERINPQDAIQQDEFDALAFDLRDNPHALALVLFLYDTGCRPTEAATLRCSWVTPYDNSAVVKYHGLVRPVRYGDYTARALTNWLKVRPKTGHDRVFFNPLSHEVFNRERLTKYFGQLLLSLRTAPDGLEYHRPGLNIWSFRSAFALRIVGSTPPKAARYMLGLPGAGQAPVMYGDAIRDGFMMTAAQPRKFLTPADLIRLIETDQASR